MTANARAGVMDVAEELDAIARYKCAREARRMFFGDIFTDPAWDIIVTLALAQDRPDGITAMEACARTERSTTRALRHLLVLSEAGLVSRTRDTRDGRKIRVALTERGLEAWRAWLAACPADPLGMLRRRPADSTRDENPFERAARLTDELGRATPHRAAAIREELDAAAPRLAARASLGERFASSFPVAGEYAPGAVQPLLLTGPHD
ncbi:hypothetical protein [Sphingomonas adhaesiva]|uniref:hypothetical protein n=1 Tax=Sphingomonas adhaesiva TaxID=28212 RepID=UPI002FF783BE